MIRIAPAVLAAGLLLAGCQDNTEVPTPIPIPMSVADTTASRGQSAGEKFDITATAARSCHVFDGRADARCTPGALNPDVTQDTIRTTICVPGWTATVRPPAAYTNPLKTAQMRDYGETGPPSSYKEDHIVPLEAGGNPTDPKNLFPQPSGPASIKDRDENQARNDICSGRKTLAVAQEWIISRWTHS